MNVYLVPILNACYIFPFLAALFTLPYVLFQYHKYGALLLLRVGIVYTFIFYMMTSYFMTILPLPPIDSVTADSACVLLVPLDAVARSVSSSGFSIADPSTYIALLTSSDFLQILFNILLLVPFGVYLRYYFNRRWYQVLILSFLYSLFFELTQLSGLYGIYPHPYRFFEVDDLICNTLGGLIGYCITPVLIIFLPARDRLDEMSYHKGMRVSAYRRLMALFIDLGILFFLLFLMDHFTPVIRWVPNELRPLILPCFALIVLTFVMILTHGYTIGKYIVNIRVADDQKEKAPAFKLMLRNLLLYGFLYPAPAYTMILASQIENIQSIYLKIGFSISIFALIVVILYFITDLFLSFVCKNAQLCYDRFLHLTVISTVQLKDSAPLDKQDEAPQD
jgi:glycopeptide antibiotics resistance protein